MNGPRQTPPIRLASAALFWRLMGGLMLLFMTLTMIIVLGKPAPLGHRLFLILVLTASCSPLAFTLSSVATLLAHVALGLIVRPRLLSWQAPAIYHSHGSFHLEPRERSDAESAARMATGRAWLPGRLILTDRRLLFIPNAWDVETWSCPRHRVRSARAVESPRMFWGLLRNLPLRLEILADDLHPSRFALSDALAWESCMSTFRAPASQLPEFLRP